MSKGRLSGALLNLSIQKSGKERPIPSANPIESQETHTHTHLSTGHMAKESRYLAPNLAPNPQITRSFPDT